MLDSEAMYCPSSASRGTTCFGDIPAYCGLFKTSTILACSWHSERYEADDADPAARHHPADDASSVQLFAWRFQSKSRPQRAVIRPSQPALWLPESSLALLVGVVVLVLPKVLDFFSKPARLPPPPEPSPCGPTRVPVCECAW